MLLKIFNKKPFKIKKGGNVGFLKFLKRSKKDKLDMHLGEDLDMPPPPPAVLNKPLPSMPKHELPPMPKPPGKEPLDEKMPTFPDLGEIKEPKPPHIEDMSKPPEFPDFKEVKPASQLFRPKPAPEMMPGHEIKAPKPIHEKSQFQKSLESTAVREQKKILDHEGAPSKPIYVKIDSFKDIKRSIGIIKNDLRNVDEVLLKLQDKKTQKDNEFNKWRNNIEEIQKKLIFVDKTLLKGD